MQKSQIKLVLLLLIAVFAVSCFAGCGNAKDVYGAASDYIKVSHPDKPNTNIFSDEADADEIDTDKTSSDADTASYSSTADKTDSDNASSVKSDSKDSSASDNNKDNSRSDETENDEEEGGLKTVTYSKGGGDYGPVVTF